MRTQQNTGTNDDNFELAAKYFAMQIHKRNQVNGVPCAYTNLFSKFNVWH